MAHKLKPKNLLFTERGEKWLKQFSAADQDTAALLVSNLTLISHSEFERGIQRRLEETASSQTTPMAFFAVHEVDINESYFSQSKRENKEGINALSQGVDHGSEARIAAIIRNFCKLNPKNRLNHPDIEAMRSARCKTIILVDDFLGSGDTVLKFIKSFLRDTSFASWHSLKYVRFMVITYAVTDRGIHAVKRHKTQPNINFIRYAPSFYNTIYNERKRASIVRVCEHYGAKTSRRKMSLGYRETMGTIIFEHGCPNNAPAILWAPKTKQKPWEPLFPNRSILSDEKSIFPPEVYGRDLQASLLDVGQPTLAESIPSPVTGNINENTLLVLAFIAKGQRELSTLCFATGLDERRCMRVVDRCIRKNLISKTKRLTPKGKAELDALRRRKGSTLGVPEIGEEYYHPSQLRRAARG